MSEQLPPAWPQAFERDAAGQKPALADPLPERRSARLLGAFIAAGLVFLVLPGTLLGVWNLLTISARQEAHTVSTAWIQTHGHAQLLGWVGTFIVGISLHTVPKFRGGALRSLPLAWAMWAAWIAGLAARWVAPPVSGVLELAVGILLIWQCSASGPSRRPGEAWEPLVFSGLAGFCATLAYQAVLLARFGLVIPAPQDLLLISMALWAFCLPVVLGFSAKFFIGFFGLAKPRLGLALAAAAFAWVAPFYAPAALLSAVFGCWCVGVFGRSSRPSGLVFVRIAYVWLLAAALLAFGAASPGMLGASRHAFTVGFLATMIFAVGPRILPSFINSRELWSKRLARVSLILLTAGCALRVTSEPLAYAGVIPGAWRTLPVSAMIELTAVLLFAFNIAKSLATPVPSWFGREQVRDSMSLYWYIASYPATRQVLIDAGLVTLAKSREVPVSLTLREAAEADGADLAVVIDRLGDFFDSRLTPTARESVMRKRQARR